ncbi:MAG: hypothetical protein GX639_11025 [Fibrobacter sp.]|nr:hypothetical protein [Fibrobacter sp.]
MKFKKIATIILSCGIGAAGVADAITGRVVNSTSNGLANTKVWLKNNPSISDSTDNDGKFSLELPGTGIISSHATSKQNSFFNVHNNRIMFSLPATQVVTLDLFDIEGKRVASLFSGTAGPDMIFVDLNTTNAPLASGMYVLKCTGHTVNATIQLNNSSGNFMLTKSDLAEKSAMSKFAAVSGPDSLIVLRMGYEIKKIALTNVAAQEVPAITLNLRTYKLQPTINVKQNRSIEVHLPSDYKDLYVLPVLYLLHGGGEDRTAWRTKGNLVNTLNSFQGRDKMQAMIIVTPDAGGNNGYGNYGKNADPFYTDLTVDIRKYVESNYKADTSRFGRAISGFSMGAMQTHNLTLFYPELFGYSYPICGGLYKSGGFNEAKMRADVASGAIDTSRVHQLKAYKLHSNETDIAWTDTRDFEKFLGSLNIRHTYDFTSYSEAGHTFSYCNAVFQHYSDEIFK